MVDRCERAREGPTLPRAVVPLAREYTTCTTAANVHVQRMAAAAAIRRFKINWRQLAERPLDVLRGRPQTFRFTERFSGCLTRRRQAKIRVRERGREVGPHSVGQVQRSVRGARQKLAVELTKFARPAIKFGLN